MSDKIRVILLGATGSIGSQACEIMSRFPDKFELVGIVSGSNVDALAKVAKQFAVHHVAVVNPSADTELPTTFRVGVQAACEIAAMDADVVCVAISGSVALQPTLSALEAGNDIAIATKEVLVMAGELVEAKAKAVGAKVWPIDSEHSAIWQCLRGEDKESISCLRLTASGGPFRERDLTTFGEITIQEALLHPNWDMGPKVTIDSATMMNKGLELIEAHFLFDMPYEKIEVVIHPGSYVHSCVEFCDGSTVAQLGLPDMRTPIALALTGGKRLEKICPHVDLVQTQKLEFYRVDPERFPAVSLARQAGIAGGGTPCVLNAANETAVAAFLAGRCRFIDIVNLVEKTIEAMPDDKFAAPLSLEKLEHLDAWARAEVNRSLQVAL